MANDVLTQPAFDRNAVDAPANRKSAPRWLDLPRQPLDRNGPTARPYKPFDRNWIEQPIFYGFCEVAAAAPDHIAVDDGSRQLTYRQLRDGAGRLAQALGTACPAARPIGVLLPNDANYPIAVLACLAAGRPCVLLDSNYPPARNAAIIADAGLGALIVADADKPAVPAGVAVVPIAAAFDQGRAAEALPGISWAPDAPALIVYTSGSTGQPKGIALAQRTFIHRTGQLIDALHLNCDDRMMPLGSPCTVAGLLQMFEALLAGAILIKLDLQRSGIGTVLDTIARTGATTLLATPALLRSLCRLEGAAEKLASLRCVHAAGDVLLNVDVEAMRRHLSPDCLFLVTYGATEAPAMCHWFVVPEAADGARVAVGYPLPDYRYAMLDEAGEPVGLDEPGELSISSRYTAVGEWQGGCLVPGRFTIDPDDPTARILNTGDLVRRRADGLMTVLGRKDRLVKIRGMRVEPYEIECALRRSPDVADATIVVRQNGENAALIAFVVLQPDAAIGSIDELRADLRRSLPAYMQPARLHPVETLPLLPGHKIDAAALLAIDDKRLAAAAQATVIAAPASGLLGDIAACWEQALDRASFEANAPFDEAGGDSLSLLMFVCELEKRCGIPLPLVDFDLAMRPGDMARVIGEIDASAAAAAPPITSSALVLLKPGAKGPPVFLTHGLGGHVGELAELARHLECDHPVYALQLPGLAADDPALDRIEAMADLFIEPILRAEPDGNYLLVGYSLGGLIAFELARRLQARGKETRLLLLDSHPHPRYWPVDAWIGYLAARIRAQCRALTRRGAGDLPGYANHLMHSFVDHLRVRRGLRPVSRIPTWLTPSATLQRLRSGMIAAKASYSPPPYPGRIAFVQPETRQIGTPENPIGAWRGRVTGLDVAQVPGDHLSMIMVHAGVTAQRLDGWINGDRIE
ncbi:MAG TPA: non-ribosomal peptide synthetase [Stellaceae bacterium]|jgi:acyl-coenzyme A synthetase/AMP-(fatty) acid ligase/thioesterase domain-containing protein/acyl carrier protein|nr:non-ribosomal peptide synthetase [Stellaceae bacterium]